MKKRRYFWTTLAVAVIAAIGSILWQRNSEPRYRGKTVEGWLAMAKRGESIFLIPEVSMMLDELGSNATPPLIAILDRDRTPVKDWCSANAIRSRWMPSFIVIVAANHFQKSTDLPNHAHSALQRLGTNAVCAIPDLERIICDPEKERGWSFAAITLANLGPGALPALQRCLTNAPPSRRPVLTSIFQQIR